MPEGFDVKQQFNIENKKSAQIIFDIDSINPEIKTLLEKLGIHVSWVECFYKKAFSMGSIHCDNSGGDTVKLLWVYGGTNSTLNWYSIKDNNNNKTLSLTEANTQYIEYSYNEVIHVHSDLLLKPALVQVGIPHCVINYKEDRYCLCFVLSDSNNNRLTMQQSQYLLRDFIN